MISAVYFDALSVDILWFCQDVLKGVRSQPLSALRVPWPRVSDRMPGVGGTWDVVLVWLAHMVGFPFGPQLKNWEIHVESKAYGFVIKENVDPKSLFPLELIHGDMYEFQVPQWPVLPILCLVHILSTC